MWNADASAVRVFLARASRRLSVMALLEGTAAGLGASAILALAGWPARESGVTPLAFGLVALAVGGVARLIITRDRRAQVALLTERAAPECRNLLVTADELSQSPPPLVVAADAADHRPSRGYVMAEVMRRAAALVAQLDAASLFPLARRAGIGAIVAVAWIASLARATDGSLAGPAASAVPMIDAVDVTIQPPAYTALPARTVRNPDRIEVFAGSRISIEARSNARAVILATPDTSRALVAGAGTQRYTGSVIAAEDGFISLEPRSDVSGARRVIGITVLADAHPSARIVAPGRDLVLADGKRAIEVAIEATDDIALFSLRLRYTKVTGSGERFTFVEGEVPLTISRPAARSWKASVRWQLDSLALEPGDMVVYRAVATDARPGAPEAESDAFIAEVASPGSVAAAGFAMDPDQDRYALSQQMIVLKAERLLARRASVDAEAYADSAAAIASEQRRVRAEFVFMMGGEINEGAVDEGNLTDINEEAEAEAESDLLAGREANLGRMALRRATRAMSLAARELNAVDVAAGLAQARVAITQLELAFARNRIILRALAVREELDPARRLSGELSELARSTRAVVPATVEERVVSLRAALADAARLSRSEEGVLADPSFAADASFAAERVLRIDPSARPMQDAASALSLAAAAFSRDDQAGARAALGLASLAIAQELGRILPRSRSGATSLEHAVAGGAIGDLLRKPRPR
ncbi:MAG: hypothetical protein O2973_13230 [Gemmatimonadetes bacterium]|nr:hypothetical protein [Gemmatimonadota bacterium]